MMKEETMMKEEIMMKEETMMEETTMEENLEESIAQLIDIGSSALHVKIVDDDVYVSNPSDGQIVVIDATNNQIKDTFDVGIPVMAFWSLYQEQNRLYATADGEAKVFVYDLTSGSLITEINFPTEEITMFSKSDKPYGQTRICFIPN